MMKLRFLTLLSLLICSFFNSALAEEASQQQTQPLIIGLDADMSSGAALGGLSIKRGIILAINEINEAGGLLGRQLRLVVRDHRGIPARGKDNIAEFAGMEHLLAVVGGVHTPVALAELETIHKEKIIYLDPWAAGTPIIENGYEPNYTFRVSVRDEYAGAFLVEQVIKRGHTRPALFLEQTGWGRSNEKAIGAALKGKKASATLVEWFHWGATSFRDAIVSARSKGSDSIILVANTREGIQLVRDMAQQPAEMRLPIISHWGITGGRFFDSVKEELSKVDLLFLQTYSFFSPPFPERNGKFIESYFSTFAPESTSREPGKIEAPVGAAHAYDLIHLLALAVKKAGSTSRPAVRDALENLESYEGLVREYRPPFRPDHHDALDASDFQLCSFSGDGAIVPEEHESL